MLFVQLAGVYKNLEKKLKRELDVFYDQKILELIELKKSLTKVLIVDKIKAEKKKKDDGGIVNIIDVEDESSKDDVTEGLVEAVGGMDFKDSVELVEVHQPEKEKRAKKSYRKRREERERRNERKEVKDDKETDRKKGNDDNKSEQEREKRERRFKKHSLVRGTRTKFNLGYYVARELYEKIYSKGKMAIENTTDKLTRSKDKVARELDIKAAR